MSSHTCNIIDAPLAEAGPYFAGDGLSDFTNFGRAAAGSAFPLDIALGSCLISSSHFFFFP
jgi:hypothetical protein